MTTFTSRRHRHLLTLVLLASCTLQPRKSSSFGDLALREIAEHPDVQTEDLFKLAYHAAMGAEHMQVDLRMAREWLDSEGALVRSDSVKEPDYIIVSPDGNIVRLNLRPYLRRKGNLDSLASAFVQTASLVKRDTVRLVSYWEEVEDLSRQNRIRIPVDSLSRYINSAREKGFPAPSHSAAYRRSNKPAYRVVHRSFLPRLGITVVP